MSGAETARRRVVQRRVGGAETAAPKWPSPTFACVCVYVRSRRSDSMVFRYVDTPYWRLMIPISLRNLLKGRGRAASAKSIGRKNSSVRDINELPRRLRKPCSGPQENTVLIILSGEFSTFREMFSESY